MRAALVEVLKHFRGPELFKIGHGAQFPASDFTYAGAHNVRINVDS